MHTMIGSAHGAQSRARSQRAEASRGLRTVGLLLLALGVFVAPLTAEAQQPAKVPRIGALRPLTPSPIAEAFWQKLRELGYVEGQNLTVERRYAEGREELLPALAAELVDLQVGVIFAISPVALRAAKAATMTIPIVALDLETDPVATGFVASLARPGGNITGVFLDLPGVFGKQLELLTETLSGLSRVAVLWDPTTAPDSVRATEAAARSLGVQLHLLEVRRPDDVDRAVQTATEGHNEALLVLSSPTMVFYRARIADLAAKSRWPAMSHNRLLTEAGGLMSYGPEAASLWQRAAVYVDKILKGAKPGDLPVERPMKFELVINLKTAKALGLTISPTLLFQADEVIQ